jgi:L-fuconolactonase
MRIDAHQHLWQTARGDYGWLTPASGTLWRDYMPTDLAPLLARHSIDRTILVQAAPTEAETLFLLDVAARTNFVAGVVGWTDFAAKDAADAIARLAADPLLVGLRPMVQNIADPDWIAMPSLAPGFKAMVAHDLVFDALVLPQHLKPLLSMLDRHPDLAVIVDHAAKPQIKARSFDPWRADIAAVASRPNTACKLSGLVTEAGPDWTIDDLKPVFDHLLAIFGPSRLIWGSDWPVLTLAASYDCWFETAMALCASLTETERADIFGNNAARLYLTKRGRKS